MSRRLASASAPTPNDCLAPGKSAAMSCAASVFAFALGACAVTAAAPSEAFDDALNALIVLGYSRSDALKALRAVNKPNADVEEMIMEALKRLS